MKRHRKKVFRTFLLTFWFLSLILVFIQLFHGLPGRAMGLKQLIWPIDENGTPKPSPIPMILHQTYASEMVRTEYQQFVSDCLKLNPQWEYFLWRDADIEAFIVDHFPRLMNRYRNLTMKIERGDIIRYMVLYHYGGLYVDMDVQCLNPFFPSLMPIGPAFLDQERKEHAHILYRSGFRAMNSVMGSVPRHPFFLAVLDAIYSVPNTAKAPLDTTGPGLVTDVYNKWIRNLTNSAYPVRLLEPHVFSPIADTQTNDFWRLCNQDKSNWQNSTSGANHWMRIGCELVFAKDWKPDSTNPNTTIGRHQFKHLGNELSQRPRDTFNISSVRSNVKLYRLHKMRPRT